MALYSRHCADVSSRQRLRSANCHHLMVPRHRSSTFGRRAFFVEGPIEWNSLPDSLRKSLLCVPTAKWRLAH